MSEKAHCSQHHSWMNGCADCTAHAALQEGESKLHKVNKKELIIEPGNTPGTQFVQQQLTRAIAIFFSKAKNAAATAASKKAKALGKAEKKDELTPEEKLLIALAAYNAIQWIELVDKTQRLLFAAATVGSMAGFAQLESSSEETKDLVKEGIQQYAADRAAEMVGLQYIGEKLVDNPTAKFVIAEATKDDIQDLVEDSFSKDLTLAQLEERIKSSAVFSKLRAQFIAKNETSRAQVIGNIEVWKHSITKVNIVLSPNHIVTDECDEHSKGSPYLIEEMPMIPAHPNCACFIEVA